MNKSIELTESQIKAYENGATMFLFFADKYRIESEFDICKFPVKKGDKDIFVQEEYKIGYWNSKTYQMAFDYKIGKNTELKYQYIESFNKMVEDSIKQLKAKNIKPDKYGNYKWKKFNSPLDWYSASQMTKDQSRYSFKECTNIQVVRVADICGNDKANIIGEEDKFGYILDDFKSFYNQQLKEQNINRTYSDNDYVFLVEFER